MGGTAPPIAFVPPNAGSCLDFLTEARQLPNRLVHLGDVLLLGLDDFLVKLPDDLGSADPNVNGTLDDGLDVVAAVVVRFVVGGVAEPPPALVLGQAEEFPPIQLSVIGVLVVMDPDGVQRLERLEAMFGLDERLVESVVPGGEGLVGLTVPLVEGRLPLTRKRPVEG